MSGAVQRILTIAGRGCVAALALALVLHGSTKRPPVCRSAAPPSPAVRTAPSVAPVPGIPDPPEAPPGMCAATNWWRRGAFSDWRRVDFPAGWSFPWGTNRLNSAALLACGEIRPPGDPAPVASVGEPLALAPLESVLWYGPTPSNTFAFVWRGALAGRDRTSPVDARIELFRNGDAVVSTNGVAWRIPRELPFAHDGYGQDADWVRANFTNAEEILSVGYAGWVDAQVGVGLANGLYRFEAVFPEDPPEVTRLFVGDFSVCVTNAGAYAFVLEKGREYRFGTEPHDGTVRYAVRDDIGLQDAKSSNRRAFAAGCRWSMSGGNKVWREPSASNMGSCCWLPLFVGAPSLAHGDSSLLSCTFRGVLTDCGPSVDVSYCWQGSKGLKIENPRGWETEVFFLGDDEDSLALSVTATVSLHQLTSSLYGWTDSPASPRLRFQMSKVIVMPSNMAVGMDVGVARLTLNLSTGERGRLELVCEQGAECIEIDGATNWQVEDSCVKEVRIRGIAESREPDGTILTARFVSDDGFVCEVRDTLTVARVWHEAQARFPSDVMRSRFAVAEKVFFFWRPYGIDCKLSSDRGSVIDERNGCACVELPQEAGVTQVRMGFTSTDLLCELETVAPQSVLARMTGIEFDDSPGTAGGICMRFMVEVWPTDVSFRHMDVMEVPQVATNVVGYFLQSGCASYLDHGKNGAGHWISLSRDNRFADMAAVKSFPPPWGGGGSFTWPIPCAWRLFADAGISGKGTFTSYEQRFELDSDGTVRLRKFGYCAERTTNNLHHVTGGGK